METGLGLRFLQQKRLNTEETRLHYLFEIIGIERKVLHKVLLRVQRTSVVVRQIRIIFDLVIEVLFVYGLQKHAHADSWEFQELCVLAIDSVRTEYDDVGLWTMVLSDKHEQ